MGHPDDIITSADAARLAGVGTTAIKRWADSGLLPCIRTAGGHRRFYRRDVERLMRGGAQDPAGSRAWEDWIDLLLQDGDIHGVQGRLFEERARRGSWHAVASSLGGLLGELGRRWETGQMTIIEEHLASALLQRALAAVADTLPLAPGAPRCLLATAEGHEHTLGLSLVELTVREAGWRTEWVGTRTPTSEVVNRVARGGLGMVVLSAGPNGSDASALAAIAVAVGEACRASGARLVMGGSGPWPELPADGLRLTDLAALYRHALDARRTLEQA